MIVLRHHQLEIVDDHQTDLVTPPILLQKHRLFRWCMSPAREEQRRALPLVFGRGGEQGLLLLDVQMRIMPDFRQRQAGQHAQGPVPELRHRHLQTDEQNAGAGHSRVQGHVEGQRGLAHGRTRPDHYQVSGIEASDLVVDPYKAGAHASRRFGVNAWAC